MMQSGSKFEQFRRLLLICITASAIFSLDCNASELSEVSDDGNMLNVTIVYRRALLQSIGDKDAVKEPVDGISLHKWLPLLLGLAFFVVFAYFVNRKAVQSAKDKEVLKILAQSPAPPNFPPMKDVAEVQPAEVKQPELFFFVEEKERFQMSDLLEAQADLQGHGLCSSLYKVKLKNNNTIFAVKRLKQSPLSIDEYSTFMKKIGELQHQNLLPLVAYGFTNETKLLIYRFQPQGSLLSQLEKYIEGKRDFPWATRLCIAVGIARGLDYIYQMCEGEKVIPHGNIKLSNILLNEDDTPLISEYGCSKLVDPKKACLFNVHGYAAPEKVLSEQSDVFSFGVILLELLTGKIVEKSGLDLPKWVRGMVREEWTGEVFDKEIAKNAKYAFPLLNISLKCVAHLPQDRPSIAEVLEKIQEVSNVHDDLSPASTTSVESTPKCLLHSVVPEEWETPGSIR
ncbi:hypothetical protein DCAR_0519545 [Daucus carota subsp. sativus]|uniref:Protein kinase domain-containing protein n=2 Tax=Daucus carota subsp. sativus TaxID=79200 RepID=A0AAF1B187_DAUCS|nr:hypothetical protein DCAR_0519545 [Daucus carota subsp. sativus]